MSMTAVGSTYAAAVGIETFMKSRGKIRKLREGLGVLNFGGKEKENEKEKEKVGV